MQWQACVQGPDRERGELIRVQRHVQIRREHRHGECYQANACRLTSPRPQDARRTTHLTDAAQIYQFEMQRQIGRHNGHKEIARGEVGDARCHEEGSEREATQASKCQEQTPNGSNQMNQLQKNHNNLPVAVIVGATSKWQSDGRNTHLAHGSAIDDSDLPAPARWGIGGAIAQKFAAEGFFVVLTTRHPANTEALSRQIEEHGGGCLTVALDLSSQTSIAEAFQLIRAHAGNPDVLVYNAGYLEGRDLPPGQELLEYISVEMFDVTQHIACRGPFLVAKEVLPFMRER